MRDMGMRRTVLVLLALLLATVAGCDSDSPGGVIALAVNEADDLIQDNLGNPDFVILDVRTPAEFAQGCIEKAINFDFMDARFGIQVRQLDRSKTYLVYCQSGGRSAMATDEMLGMGFGRLYDMTGGFLAWVDAGLPWVTP